MGDATARLDRWITERFDVLGRLGAGSFGVVHHVRDRASGRELALKTVRGAPDPRRLSREIDAMRRIDHPHVLPLLASFCEEDVAGLVLPLAEGNLHAIIRAPGERRRCWELLAQACAGVAALHAAGLVHRDLKPENILLVDGAARVADFGLTRGAGLATVTGTGIITGTPAYMAPEQARGERPVAATDAFALGLMLWEALHGRLPYHGDGAARLLAEVAEARQIPVDDPVVPDAARALLAGMLAPNPDARPRDLAAVAELLRRHPPDPGRGMVTTALPADRRPPLAVAEVSTLRRRRSSGRLRARSTTARRVAGTLAGALLVAAGVAAVAERSPGPEPPAGRASPAAPAPVAAWLDDAWSARARTALSDLLAAPPEPLRTDGALTRDPRFFGAVLLNLRPIGEFFAWSEDGGRCEELPGDARTRLREIDSRLAGAGFPPVFEPFLEVAPDEDGGARGWIVRGLRELRAAREAWTELEASLIARAPSVPGVLVGRTHDPLQGLLTESTARDPLRRLRFVFRDGLAENALALDAWVRPPVLVLRRALVALARGLRELPRARDGEALSSLLATIDEDLAASRGLLESHLAGLPVRYLFGQPLEDPRVAALACHVVQRVQQQHRKSPAFTDSLTGNDELIQLALLAIGAPDDAAEFPEIAATAFRYLVGEALDVRAYRPTRLLEILEAVEVQLGRLPREYRDATLDMVRNRIRDVADQVAAAPAEAAAARRLERWVEARLARLAETDG